MKLVIMLGLAILNITFAANLALKGDLLFLLNFIAFAILADALLRETNLKKTHEEE